MLSYPSIDPVIFSLGPLQVRWYGLMYVIGFMAAYHLVARQAQRIGWEQLLRRLDNLNLALIAGVILGGRLGYVLLYNPAYYWTHPVEIAATWEGGMSFHGACIGAITAGIWYCHRAGLSFWRAADLYVVTVPIGLFFGRIGNFINGELYGRVTQAAWGMAFPEGGTLPRHPSQLYEAAGEGLLLFVILWSVRARPWTKPQAVWWPHGSMLALFLMLYGALRFFLEFFRQPDSQLGFVALGMSMGQALCLIMVGAGVLIWYYRAKTKAPAQNLQ